MEFSKNLIWEATAFAAWNTTPGKKTFSSSPDRITLTSKCRAKLIVFTPWAGKPKDTPRLDKNFDLTEYNIEAAFFFPSSKKNVRLLSDDGTTCQKGKAAFRAILQKF